MSVGIGTTEIEIFEFTPPEELEEVQYYDPFTFNEDGSVDLDLNGNLNVSGNAEIEGDLIVQGVNILESIQALLALHP
jgi:hypothetical protein